MNIINQKDVIDTDPSTSMIFKHVYGVMLTSSCVKCDSMRYCLHESVQRYYQLK